MNSYFGTNYKAYTKEALDFTIISGSKDISKCISMESIHDSRSFYYLKDKLVQNEITHKFYQVLPVIDAERKPVALIGRSQDTDNTAIAISGSIYNSYAIAWCNFMHTMNKMNPTVKILDTIDQYKDFILRYVSLPTHEKHWIITNEDNTRVMAMYSYEIKNDSLILYNVYTNPAFRKQGLLREMLRHAENECLKYGCKRVFFTVYKKNLRAQKCYGKCGYTRTKTNYIRAPELKEAQ